MLPTGVFDPLSQQPLEIQTLDSRQSFLAPVSQKVHSLKPSSFVSGTGVAIYPLPFLTALGASLLSQLESKSSTPHRSLSNSSASTAIASDWRSLFISALKRFFFPSFELDYTFKIIFLLCLIQQFYEFGGGADAMVSTFHNAWKLKKEDFSRSGVITPNFS